MSNKNSKVKSQSSKAFLASLFNKLHTKERLVLQVKVIPKSSRNEVVGTLAGVLKIKLQAVPEKGKANQELLAFLAKELNLPVSHITILRGATSSLKTLHITP